MCSTARSPKGSSASRSGSSRIRSTSITWTCAARCARCSERTPRPPPISSTTSSGSRPASRSITSRMFESIRKFWPSSRLGRMPNWRIRRSEGCVGSLTTNRRGLGGVGVDLRRQLVVGDAALDRDQLRRQHDVGRHVALLADRLRAEVRRVGLDQQAVRRHAQRGAAEVGVGRIGDVAGERDPVAALDALVDAVGHREAVQDHSDAVGLLLQQVERRLVGAAGVDHERLGGLARERDLGAEGAPLVGLGRSFTVEVEPGLADRAALRMGRERAQLGEVGVVEAGRRVGMAADPDVDLREVLRHLQRRAAGVAVGADRQQPRDAGVDRGGDQLGRRRGAGGDVGVAVDHLCGFGKSGSIAAIGVPQPAAANCAPA